MKILAIEDDPIFAEWCRKLVLEASVHVASFDIRPSLAAGIEFAKESKPSLIFLDLNLEDTRGVGTVHGIPVLDGIAPTIIVSGVISHDLDSELLQLCYQAGAVGHIFKKHFKPTSVDLVAGMIVSAGYNWRRIHCSK